jgi:hypothetical protein
MSSHRILPTAHADYFSSNAVRSLFRDILPTWSKWRQDHIRKIEEVDSFEDKYPGFYTFSGKPAVLPILVHRYDVDTKKIEEVQGNFIHSIRYIIDEFKVKVDLKLVPDGEGNHVVPFCRNLSRAPQISHIHGIPHVHLLEEGFQLSLQEEAKDWAGTSNSANGNRDAKIAKTCFERLADFVESSRKHQFGGDGVGLGGAGEGERGGGSSGGGGEGGVAAEQRPPPVRTRDGVTAPPVRTRDGVTAPTRHVVTEDVGGEEDGEERLKRSRKSVDRLSSTKLQVEILTPFVSCVYFIVCVWKRKTKNWLIFSHTVFKTVWESRPCLLILFFTRQINTVLLGCHLAAAAGEEKEVSQPNKCLLRSGQETESRPQQGMWSPKMLEERRMEKKD